MDQQQFDHVADEVSQEPSIKGGTVQASPVLAAQRAADVIALAQAQREARKVISEPTTAATPTQRAGRYL